MICSNEASAKAIGWLVDGVERYLSTEGASEKAEFRRLKAICEISFIVALLPGESGARSLLQTVSKPLNRVSQGGRFLTAIWHQPQHANLYLPMLYALLCLGKQNDAERADIARLLQRLARMRKERQPFRTLDFLYTQYLLSSDESHRVSMQAAADFGCLGENAGVLNYTDGDEYAVTHSVFYLTGFGAWQWPYGDASRRSTCKLLKALSLDALSAKNWDLYSEYRSSEVMLGADLNNIDEAPLLAAQSSDGSWSGPVDLEIAIKKEGFTEETGLIFYEDYHTTLVAWMALVLPHSPVAPKLFKSAAIGLSLDLGSKYPSLTEDWINLWNAFQSLSNDELIVEPAATLPNQPQGVLPCLEWWYWQRRLELGVPPQFAPGPDLDVAIADAARTGAWRKLRCALLGSNIDTLDEELIARLHKTLSAVASVTADDILAAEGLDRVVSWALLRRSSVVHGAVSGSALVEAVERTLLLALRRRDIFAPGPLLAFAGDLVDGDLCAQARQFMEEAVSLTLPYGFISGASAIEQRRCLTAECYLLQADIAKRLNAAAKTAQ